MVTSRKVKGRAVSMPLGVVWGVITAILIMILLVAVLAGMIMSNEVNTIQLGYYIMGILLLSSFVGSLISGIMIKRRWILVSLIVGTACYLILLLTTAIVFGGRFQGVTVTGVMIMMGSLASGAIGVGMHGDNSRHAKKFRAS